MVVVHVPEEELGGRDPAGAAGPATSSSASSASATAGSSGGGVGVGDRATDRAPVADLEVADERDRLGEQRHRLPGRGVVLDVGLAGHGPDRERAVRPLDAAQLVDPVEVDDVLEAGEAQGEHRHQALPTGEHLGVVGERASIASVSVVGRRMLERRRFTAESWHKNAVRGISLDN